MVHGVLKARILKWFAIPFSRRPHDVGPSTMTRPSWVALHGMAHSFFELDKAVVHVIRLVQFSSVTQSCLTLCDPINCSMSGLPVHHQHRSSLKLSSIKSVMPSIILSSAVPLSSCPQSLPASESFPMVHGVLKARILKWLAIPFSSGPHSDRPLHHDPPVLGCPAGMAWFH